MSIAVDSYFWNRLCYPELEVFYFNVVLNKSAAWGVSPFHWYFSNALPRALGGNLLLAMMALGGHARKMVGIMVAPAIIFVCMYSGLRHKELRFVFYALPVLNAAAAIAVEEALRGVRGGMEPRKEGLIGRRRVKGFVVGLFVTATLGLSVSQTIVSTVASSWNYPGAHALRAMHEKERTVYRGTGMCERVGRVHIDAECAMNGVSQFVQVEKGEDECPRWVYSKREDVRDGEWGEFTHLVTGRSGIEGFCVVHMERGFDSVDWRRGRLRTAVRAFVLRNLNASVVGCLDR